MLLKSIVFKLVAPANALSPIVLITFDNLTVSKLVALLKKSAGKVVNVFDVTALISKPLILVLANAPLPNLPTVAGKVITASVGGADFLANLVMPEFKKAPEPMTVNVSVFGKSIVFSIIVSWKELLPNVLISVLLRSNFCNPFALLNALSPIASSLFGKLTFLSSAQPWKVLGLMILTWVLVKLTVDNFVQSWNTPAPNDVRLLGKTTSVNPVPLNA